MQTIHEWLSISIIIAPISVFIITVIIILVVLTKQKVSLANILAETEVVLQQQKLTREEAEDDKNNTKTTSIKPNSVNRNDLYLKHSVSRLILLISMITGLALGSCITSFYFFVHIYCLDNAVYMDLSDFTNILMIFSIGVIPYAVNQIKKIRL